MMSHPRLIGLSILCVLSACSAPPAHADKPPAQAKPQLTAIRVTCTPTTLVQRTATTCTASATDQNGDPFTVSSYTWTSSDAHVAKVDAQGNVTTSKAGTAILTASASADGTTQQGQASITVTEHAPTYHSSDITTSQTWTLNDSPHVVQKPLLVDGTGTPPTLTLEAGVEVHFAEDTELRVKNGTLQAQSTPDDPILLVANQPNPPKGFWRGLAFDSNAGPSLLEHVTLSDCGKESDVSACLSILSTGNTVLHDVTVHNSATYGVQLPSNGSFGAGSTQLSVSGCDDLPVIIAADHADSVPTEVTLTNNPSNTIRIIDNVTRSQTWVNPGVPFSIPYVLSVEGPDSSTPTVLTLSQGIVLRFAPEAALDIATNSKDYPADLIVNGTDAAPVRFTADSDSPKPGMWKGVHLGDLISSTTSISNAIFEYAGGDRGTGYSTGNLNLYGSIRCTDCPTLAHITAQNGSSYGISMSYGTLNSHFTDFKVNSNGSYAINAVAEVVGSIPKGSTFNGNSPNAIAVSGKLASSQTWNNLGIPYVITGSVDVGGTPSAPKLIVEAGSELRFNSGTELTVGADATQPGALVVAGTAQAPVQFLPNTSTPTKGFWGGIHFMHGTGSQVDYALVSYAGGSDRILYGNLNVYQERGAFVKHSTFTNSSTCGIMISDGTFSGTDNVTTDFTLPTYGNIFTGNTTAPQCAD